MAKKKTTIQKTKTKVKVKKKDTEIDSFDGECSFESKESEKDEN